MVNSKWYTGIDRYPKYIVLVAKSVQPPVRYWLLWHICTVTIVIVYKYTISHPLMWVFFWPECVKWRDFCILEGYEHRIRGVDALNIISLLTFWVSHDMSIGYVVWDRDCKKKKKKKKKKKRSTKSPLKKKVRDLHLEKKNSREFVAWY